MLITAGTDGVVRAWDVDTNKQIGFLENRIPVESLLIIPRTNKLLMSHFGGGNLKGFELTDKKQR
jgi:hypothetical protein